MVGNTENLPPSLPPQVTPSLLRRTGAAAGLGTLVEFFDYAAYSYLATTLGTVFFPAADPATALLDTFAIFAASFLMRPIGAVVWGHVGDRWGRQRTLATTIVIMSGSTFAVAFIPSHATIGIAAPFLLLLLRLTQSFSAAGEYSGAGVFLAEYAPRHARGRYASIIPSAAAAGFLAASLFATVLYHSLSEQAMTSWAWRLPFLIAGPLGAIGLYLRNRLEDSPQFRDLAERRNIKRAPVRDAIKADWRPLLLLFMIIALNAGGYYLLLSYTPTYLTQQAHMSSATANLIVTIALAIYVGLVPLTAWLSDRVGRKPVLAAASVLFIALTYPALALLSSTATVVIAFFIVLGLLVIFSFNDAVFPAFFAENFATHSRYTGFALPFNLGNAIFGGTAPYIATWLIAHTGTPRSPALYLMALALVALIAVVLSHETHRNTLR